MGVLVRLWRWMKAALEGIGVEQVRDGRAEAII